MTFGALAGYIASVLVFATFCMKTIVPLRLVAIGSNVFFLLYGIFEGLVPILLLHLALLPLNVLRLAQLRVSAREIEHAFDEAFSPSSILPLMEEQELPAGSVIFTMGEAADAVYLLAEGRVELPELGIELQAGEMFGEIGLFSDRGDRTASAVMAEDGLLYRLARKDLANALVQHPRMGVHLLRLITRRLMENAKADRPEAPPAPAESQGTAIRSPLRLERQAQRRSARLGVIVLATLALLVGAVGFAPTAWWLLSRDAAVTTWVNQATSSISGNIISPLPTPGSVVDETGRLVDIADDHADRGHILRAEAALQAAEAEVLTLQAYAAAIETTVAAWDSRAESYARAFREKLEINIQGLRSEIGSLNARLALARAAAERSESLSKRGFTSEAAEEEQRQHALDLEERQAERRKQLAELELRLKQARAGVYFDEFGRNPDWAFQSRDLIALETEEVKDRLGLARVRRDQAQKELWAAEQSYIDQTSAVVRAPPGSIVWSRIAGEGAAVIPGTPIVSWIDCGDLLIDVPTSDIAMSLLRPGGEAAVTLEGESSERPAAIVLTRGAAATLGADDLAALASGHDATTAQVLLRFRETPAFEDCPVGLAASVDFVEISFLDLVVAFFRL